MNKFELKANKAFKQQVESLDSQTLHRLRKARESALSQKTHSWFSLKWLGGAGIGLALASVLTLVVVPNMMQSNSLSPLDDLEMLSAEADMDLVTQMDFYQWLDDSSLSESTL